MKKVIWTLLLFVSFVLVTNAASYSVSVGYKTLTKGSSTTLTISGSDVTGRFNIKTSDASVVSVSEGSVWIENNSYKVTLTALKVGNATITITPQSGTSDGSGNPVDLGSKSINMSVSLPREKSSNNNLKSITVEGYELTPEFNKDTLEYKVSVPSTVDKVVIKAEKADNYASVEGDGEHEVIEGSNEFEIVVTSETGVAKKYKVIVMVEDLNPIEVTVDKETYTIVKNIKSLTAPDNYAETTVQIGTNTVPGFYNNKTKYKLVGLKDSAGNISLFIYDNGKYTKYDEIKSEGITIVALDFPKRLQGYMVKTIDINGAKTKVLVVNNQSKFAIVYGVNVATGKKDYYEYDIKNNTLSRYNDEMINELLTKNKNYSYIILGTASATAIFFLLTMTFMALNNRKKKLIKKLFEKSEAKPFIEPSVVEKSTKKNQKELEDYKPIIEEKTKEPKREKKQEIKEEVKETTEVYDIFEDERKSRRRKSKK